MGNPLDAAAAKIESALNTRALSKPGPGHYVDDDAERDALIQQLDAVTEGVQAIIAHLRTS